MPSLSEHIKGEEFSYKLKKLHTSLCVKIFEKFPKIGHLWYMDEQSKVCTHIAACKDPYSV